jgi:hypothetical protein
VARTVRQYIDQRPVIRDALRMGIVNLSALTRRIQAETGLTQEEAVLVACRRYQPDATNHGYEEGIRRVLDRSKLEVRTKVAVWTLRKSWHLTTRLEKAMPRLGQEGAVHVLHGSEAVTLIADEGLNDAIRTAVGEEDILKHRTGLVEVNLRTPARVEDVPGILAFLCSSLAGRGINFVEVVSCHKDNMFVIEEGDLFDAFQVLNGLIQA